MEKKIRGSQERTLAGTTMRRSLERIIREEDITTHFQPIVDLHDETILGFEVLSRTRFPLSCPTELFRVAGALNLSWELESACSMAAFRRIAALPPWHRTKEFFINISPRCIADPRPVAGFAASSLKALSIERCRIVIEVTETCRMSAYPSFAERMHQYAEQGYRIALDDFGSGYSGLMALVALAPQFIKLDKALIHDVHRNPYQQKLIRAVAGFAASVGSIVIAEGIERAEEKRVVADLGVAYGQGFLFAHPSSNPPALVAQDAACAFGKN